VRKGALLVIHVRTEKLERGVQELLMELHLVVRTAPVFVGVPLEALNEAVRVLGCVAGRHVRKY
jgi:hypothetical protein